MDYTEEQCREAILAVARANTLTKDMIEAHDSLLLKDETDAVFLRLREEYRDEPETLEGIRMAHIIIRACRELGVDAVLADLKQLEEHEQMINRLRQLKTGQDFAQFMREYPELVPKIQELLHEQAEAAAQENPEKVFDLRLKDWMLQPGWSEKHAYLEEHPELLTDEADQVMLSFVQRAEQQGNTEGIGIFTEHRNLLLRCREVGIEVAFEDVGFVSPRRTELMHAMMSFTMARILYERRRIVEQHEDLLLTDEADSMFDEMLEQHKEGGKIYQTIVADRVLLRRCREVGIAAAFAEQAAQQPLSQQIHDAVMTCINASSIEAKKHLVQEKRDLLFTDEADQIFVRLIEHYHESAVISRMIKENHKLIQKCRDRGIEAVFAELGQPAGSTRSPARSMSMPSMSPPTMQEAQVGHMVMTLINTEALAEKKQYIKKNKTLLLSDTADQIFDQLLAQYQHEDHVYQLFDRDRVLLRRCREVGINAAFAEHSRS
ncbi:MAG: hypothetical protein HC837_14920 [Chloroflexaceae bacterium]|nr:hypothetical protein [Chloroflexaceae bacterium]